MSNGNNKTGGIVNPDATIDHKAGRANVQDDIALSQKLAGTKVKQDNSGAPQNAVEGVNLNSSPLADLQRKNAKKKAAI